MVFGSLLPVCDTLNVFFTNIHLQIFITRTTHQLFVITFWVFPKGSQIGGFKKDPQPFITVKLLTVVKARRAISSGSKPGDASVTVRCSSIQPKSKVNGSVIHVSQTMLGQTSERIAF